MNVVTPDRVARSAIARSGVQRKIGAERAALIYCASRVLRWMPDQPMRLRRTLSGMTTESGLRRRDGALPLHDQPIL
jgi:hypothetical protein